ncbi:MAG: hypothetical protein RLZZ546_1020 [Bacteroidota bacterium]|jgi:uncharacterized protein (TIGR01777 family)
MKTILIAGGSGMIGQRLTELLQDRYYILILTRNTRVSNHKNVSFLKWNPAHYEIDETAFQADILINLCGEGIADKRWTSNRKKLIIDSRVKPIEFLHKKFIERRKKLDTIICASAIGYYGNVPTETLTEKSQKGGGFLSDSTSMWEKASRRLHDCTDRIVILRIGIVLSRKGGALPKMLMTSGMGMLNYFGNGRQYYSWIHIDDLANIFDKALLDSQYTGTINAVAPDSVTNRVFIENIEKASERKFFKISVPTFVLRLLLGEMADVILNSNKIHPSVLLNINHSFLYSTLHEALKNLINKKA